MSKRIVVHSFEVLLQLFLSIIGIICVGALPGLFQGLQMNVSNYIQTLKQLGVGLLHISSLTYIPITQSKHPEPRDLFPQLFVHYKETMIVFLASFFISLIVAFVIVYILLRSNEKFQKRIKSFLLLLESIPDILLIIGSQLFVIWIFQQTGILAVNIAGVGGKSVIGLPIICLSLPTTIMFVKLLMLRFDTELEKDYVLFAKAKGLDTFYILNHHVLRNVLLSTLYFAKTNIWFMLSNLYIIEYLFNTLGIFIFIREHPTVEIFTVSLLLLYIPIFIIFKLAHYFVPASIKEAK
ncbi:ABC transporter permease subunit [Bacillus sp. DX1.1]|uniref:ABC transporter permease subunit n=1 Tax=unclassified Bacillus (in: firmicutes) TaxID=185979 RepID=UPI0025A1CF1C|nr:MULTISPECIES: ABC transporter permease subunit [unclassified Bacillus (in: firmicutes)]MDM5153565.1 ABC transporter permease subunit [Bacillus sp. DX1.1]MDM5187238.1 ABC transporter permease subunit [Bacillus sp. DX4.1]